MLILVILVPSILLEEWRHWHRTRKTAKQDAKDPFGTEERRDDRKGAAEGAAVEAAAAAAT